jgi:hypothetical protein
MPELFSAPALQRLLDKRRREKLVAVPYFDGPLSGEPDALLESFAGEPEVYDPVRRRIKGAQPFNAFIANTREWLAQRNASVEDVEHVVLERRGFEEVVLHLDDETGPVDLPFVIVADRGTRTPSKWISACQMARAAPLPSIVIDCNPRGALLHQEHLDLAVGCRARPDDENVGNGAIPDPAFDAIDHPVIAVATRAGGEGNGVRSVLGSVSANAPITSRRAIAGSHFSFCSSDPRAAIDFMAKPDCTPRNVPTLPSPRWSSMLTSPRASGLIPGQP